MSANEVWDVLYSMPRMGDDVHRLMIIMPRIIESPIGVWTTFFEMAYTRECAFQRLLSRQSSRTPGHSRELQEKHRPLSVFRTFFWQKKHIQLRLWRALNVEQRMAILSDFGEHVIYAHSQRIFELLDDMPTRSAFLRDAFARDDIMFLTLKDMPHQWECNGVPVMERPDVKAFVASMDAHRASKLKEGRKKALRRATDCMVDALEGSILRLPFAHDESSMTPFAEVASSNMLMEYITRLALGHRVETP